MNSKKIITTFLIMFFIMAYPPNSCLAQNQTQSNMNNIGALESKSIVLLEANSGEILYAQNADDKRLPASVTKLMTLLLIAEAVENGRVSWDDNITASQYAASMGGTQIYLACGETMSLKELTIAIAVGSANDAAIAISEYLTASEDAFVILMNEKAAALGMTGTHFANPHGLPQDEHYTTAYDLALLCREIVNNHPQILEFTSLKSYTLREKSEKPFVLYNKNKLLWWYDGADGLKTGWIGESSGYNVAATAERNGLCLIVVALGAEKTYGNFRDAIKLFDWGFGNYTYQTLYDKNEIVTTAAIEKGEKLTLNVYTKEKIGYLRNNLANDSAEIQSEIIIDQLTAPIKKDTEIGRIILSQNGAFIRTYPLYAAEDIDKYSFFQALARMSYYLLT